MTSRVLTHWIVRAGALGAVLFLFGCSSGKPYSLVASLPAGDHVVIGSIEVNEGKCSVHFASFDWMEFYTPPCKILKDQSAFKSFKIGDSQVDLGAVDNGFKVLSVPPKLPGTDLVATAPAAAAGTKPATPAPAAATGTAAPAASVGEDFPGQWTLQPYPGNEKLVGQNPGFPLNSATLMIMGGDASLDTDYKVKIFKPLHLKAIVVTNEHGDYRVVFNPHLTASQTSGGNYDVSLVSEGSGISGNIWDSHGFDSWTPSLPPTWTASVDSQ